MRPIEEPVLSPQKRREEWEKPVREQSEGPDDVVAEAENCPRDFDDYPYFCLEWKVPRNRSSSGYRQVGFPLVPYIPTRPDEHAGCSY